MRFLLISYLENDDLVFRSLEGAILDPDNLYHRFFLPVLAKAGIRKIRLHDLRHTFGHSVNLIWPTLII